MDTTLLGKYCQLEQQAVSLLGALLEEPELVTLIDQLDELWPKLSPIEKEITTARLRGSLKHQQDILDTPRELLVQYAHERRAILDKVFAPDTAFPGTISSVPSAGHCAITALLVHDELGGDLISTIVNATSHWYNLIYLPDGEVQIDLTGDQFGLPTIQVSNYNKNLHAEPARIRDESAISGDTFYRYRVFCHRINHQLSLQAVERIPE